MNRIKKMGWWRNRWKEKNESWFKAYLDKQKSKGKKDSKAEDTKEDRKMRRVKGLTAAQETSAALQAGILKDG
jgi:hypothetical protein